VKPSTQEKKGSHVGPRKRSLESSKGRPPRPQLRGGGGERKSTHVLPIPQTLFSCLKKKIFQIQLTPRKEEENSRDPRRVDRRGEVKEEPPHSEIIAKRRASSASPQGKDGFIRPSSAKKKRGKSVTTLQYETAGFPTPAKERKSGKAKDKKGWAGFALCSPRLEKIPRKNLQKITACCARYKKKEKKEKGKQHGFRCQLKGASCFARMEWLGKKKERKGKKRAKTCPAPSEQQPRRRR